MERRLRIDTASSRNAETAHDFCLSAVSMLVPFLTIALSSLSMGQGPTALLRMEDARLLVVNVPKALSAKAAYRRPSAELLRETQDEFVFQLRSGIARGFISGLLGNYEVDRRNGRVRDIDLQQEVDPPQLRRLREHILNRAKSVVQSQQTRSIDLEGGDLARAVREANTFPVYSLWGVTLGQPFPKSLQKDGKEVLLQALGRDLAAGQFLSGYSLWAGLDGQPLVEVYLSEDGRAAEMYIEITPSEGKDSLALILGKQFVNSTASMDQKVWSTLIGSEPLVERSSNGSRNSLFVDFPAKRVCACVVSTPAYVEPVFLSFYDAEFDARGETLADAVIRRTMSCVK